jgi:hypothetical protein
MRSVLTLLLASLAAIANAQVAPKTFSFFAENDLTSQSENCTVQKPSAQTSARTDFLSATFYSEAEVTIILELGVAVAEDTNGDIVTMNHGESVNEAFCSSEVEQGEIIHIYHLSAGEEKSISLRSIVWPATTGARNLTLRTSEVTGIVRRNIVWQESP